MIPRISRWALVFVCLVVAAGAARASTEEQFRQLTRYFKAAEARTGQEVKYRLKANPAQFLELRGQISGLVVAGSRQTLLFKMADGDSEEIRAEPPVPDLQTGARLKVLAQPQAQGSYFLLRGFTWDTNPQQPTIPQTTVSTGSPSGPGIIASGGPLPSRGGISLEGALERCREWIAEQNSRLSTQERELIARSIVAYSLRYGISPFLVLAIVDAESNFNPRAQSYKGAMGLGQLMPSTARGLGVNNPWDPVQNLEAAIRLIRGHLDKYEDRPDQLLLALAAYNAGSGAVRKHGGVPPYRETVNYIWAIYGNYCRIMGVEPVNRPR